MGQRPKARSRVPWQYNMPSGIAILFAFAVAMNVHGTWPRTLVSVAVVFPLWYMLEPGTDRPIVKAFAGWCLVVSSLAYVPPAEQSGVIGYILVATIIMLVLAISERRTLLLRRSATSS